MVTETIDRLYLELAQITTAKTPREATLEKCIKQLMQKLDSGDVWDERAKAIYQEVLNNPTIGRG